MKKKIVIIGYGSAGRRYAKLLKKYFKNFEIYILTKQKKIGFFTIGNFRDIIKINPKYIIVSSPTNLHFDQLKKINKNFKNISVLVEKPLFDKFEKIKNKNKVYVGYNLRNLKIIKLLKSIIKKNIRKINNVSFLNHSFLPDWRKNINYENSSSAKKKYGGGIILDCSHEIDLANWFFGNIDILFVDKSKKSNLKINTEDNCKIYGKKNNISLSFDFNYYSPEKKREIIILGHNFKIVANLVSNNFLMINNNKKIKRKFKRNEIEKSYKLEIQGLLSNKKNNLVNFESALKTQKIIQSIKDF